MKTIVIYIFFSFILGFSAYSQFYPLLPKYYQALDSTVLVDNKDENKEEKKKSTLMKRHPVVSSSVSLGTSYSSFGNNSSIMSSYVAPSVSYWVSPKLNFTVTGIFMYSNMSGMENIYGYNPEYSFNSNMSYIGVSGSTYYQVSEKLSVWGDGMYLENQSVFSDSPNNMYNNDFKTASIGIGYKVSDNFHFNVQYRIVEGINPAYNFNSPFYGSPRFGYDPFHSNFGIWDY